MLKTGLILLALFLCWMLYSVVSDIALRARGGEKFGVKEWLFVNSCMGCFSFTIGGLFHAALVVL
jgi:hypothetical protein